VADGTFNFADQFSLDSCGVSSKGGFDFTGSVRFFEGLALPAAFVANNPATIAGDLPSTAANPGLKDGTSAVAHRIAGTWDCCPKGKAAAAANPTVFTSHTP
jgi:hypothetical protein